jgi:hypothetical protein
MAEAVMSFTQDFPNAGGGILDTFASFLPINLGVPVGIVKGVSKKYIITISSAFTSSGVAALSTSNGVQPTTIHAFLQDKFRMKVGSKWGSVGYSSNMIATALAQGTFGRVFYPTVTTRRVWEGSTPVTMTIPLRFEAFDNIITDVTQPIRRLQGMSLPREGGNSWFLIPPGPNPFKFNDAGNSVEGAGDYITISIGDFLTFKSVVIDNVDVEWDSKFGDQGPVGASVNLTFTTYEMLTQEKLAAAYTGGIQTTEAETPMSIKQSTSIAGGVGLGANLGQSLGNIFKQNFPNGFAGADGMMKPSIEYGVPLYDNVNRNIA